MDNVGTQILSRYTEVKKYWSNPPHRRMGKSEAATKIKNDVAGLTKWD
jgi:hypothetical protein